MAGLDLGAIAQLGERYTGSVEVGGSIPPGSTNLTKRGRKFMRPFLCPEIIEPPTVSASRVRVQSIPPGSTNLTSKGAQIYASFFVPRDNRTADGVGVSRSSPIDPD